MMRETSELLGRGTRVQKSLKLINVGNESHDTQKVNKSFLKRTEFKQIIFLANWTCKNKMLNGERAFISKT